MRSTQLATLRAIQAGTTTQGLAARLGIPLSSAAGRLRTLARDGFVFTYRAGRGYTWELTDKARSLLEARARLDGETTT